jgi:hypothetical protein
MPVQCHVHVQMCCGVGLPHKGRQMHEPTGRVETLLMGPETGSDVPSSLEGVANQDSYL